MNIVQKIFSKFDLMWFSNGHIVFEIWKRIFDQFAAATQLILILSTSRCFVAGGFCIWTNRITSRKIITHYLIIWKPFWFQISIEIQFGNFWHLTQISFGVENVARWRHSFILIYEFNLKSIEQIILPAIIHQFIKLSWCYYRRSKFWCHLRSPRRELWNAVLADREGQEMRDIS